MGCKKKERKYTRSYDNTQSSKTPQTSTQRLEISGVIPNYRHSRHRRVVMASKDEAQHMYRVLFQNQGQVYEVYARNIYQSELYGFVEIEDYTFGNKSSVVIDPSEETLRNEFEGGQRSFIPMHAVVRIDVVEKEGGAKITSSDGSTVTPFPMPVPTDR